MSGETKNNGGGPLNFLMGRHGTTTEGTNAQGKEVRGNGWDSKGSEKDYYSKGGTGPVTKKP